MSKCRESSIVKCIECRDYQCKNLYGPIKENSRCYQMIENKLFDECIFGCEHENDLNGCCSCAFKDSCSTLIGESVVLLGV